MFFERMMNQTNAPMLEQMLQFTASRHKLILENLANTDVLEYKQKDLSLDKFQQALRERVEEKGASAPGSVGFDHVIPEVEHPNNGILSHDGNNRSLETLQSDLAKNALMHNMVVELLRKQFQQMEMALKERVS